MEQYQFQYTKPGRSAVVGLICMAIIFSSIGVGKRLKLNILIIEGGVLIIAILVFLLVRKMAVFDCTATIKNDCIEFDFGTFVKTFYFTDLISFKAYYGKNVSVLYLNIVTEKFKIYANDYFCKREALENFCHVIIAKLDAYRIAQKPELIHEGSIYATKKMFYFLLIITFAYLIGFFFESESLRVAIGIRVGGGLAALWFLYFVRRNQKSSNA